ncbi:SsrA-binding protein [Chthoniobacter flavus Ellin428]|uniref:SsrA-binding protein n=1 Tax=Chthoniobacter flavus Ellin428 TaxID=497964 RepID=B4DCN7_9BACT|nr:SsrA-binding protein SmpB [Chthoniobacter flavus]EDY15802.1 SsrA-binding protein [Chthoniobacter flavus Ellin428]TCO81585.1 SsrA-binding protein [Chthoniobacter flavus]
MSAEISVNRKALRDYHILERFEAGLELKGTEVKSIRLGLANINNAFARVENGQAYVYDIDIQPYVRASFEQHESKRIRRLLLHKQEIDRLFGQTQIKGHTLVALRLYWKDARVKIEIAVGKGKEAGDKRQDLKAKATKRETDREVARFNKKHA